MKHYYRLADLMAQVGILVVWLIVYVKDIELLADLYFIAGGWFLISLVIHYIISTRKYEETYKAFSVAVIIIILVFCVAFIWPVLFLFEGYTLFFLAPPLALAYTVICFKETRYLRKRPIAYLK